MINFKIVKHSDLGYTSLVIEHNRIDDCIDYMLKNGLKNLILNSEWGWNKIASLKFVEDNLWIEGIEIVDDNLDLSILNKLTKLKHLALSGEKYEGVLDFNNFKDLKSYSGNFNLKFIKNFENADKCEYLYLFKFPYTTLMFFKNFLMLQNLTISYGKLESIEGVDKLENLQKLDFYSLPNFESIKSIKNCYKKINFLSIDKCKKLCNYDEIEYLSNLKRLFIADSGAINSIKFIENFENLEYCYIGVEILDRDTEILKRKGFEFKKKKK